MRTTRISIKIFTCMALVFLASFFSALASGTVAEPASAPVDKGGPAFLDNAPAIAFDSTEFEFADALDGDLVTHVYTFKNTGKMDLEIKQVKVG